MHKWSVLVAILFLPMSAVAQTSDSPQSPNAAQVNVTYDQSEDGFRSQFNAIVESYRAGNNTEGHQLIDRFRLPQSEKWFSEHLAPDQSAKLTARYDRLFANFAESLEQTIEDVVGHPKSDMVTNLEEGKGENPSDVRRPGAKLSGMVSVRQPNLFYGHFRVIVKTKDSMSWADTFVHEDGAFRFLGFGAWPFWVWEDGSEGGAPKGGRITQPPTLITQVPAVYPASARAMRTEGVVIVRVKIDKEGRVKKADVLKGDPLLAQAAVDAVRQWRYKPGTLGGAPAESFAIAQVVFTLH